MSNDEKALVKPIEFGQAGIVLRTTGDIARIAETIHRAGLAPKSLDTSAKVGVAILHGAEIGLSPMQAVRSIYVVNRVPTVLTKAARALVQASGLLKPGTRIQEGVIHEDGCPHKEPGKRCLDGCYGYCRSHHVEHATPREHRFHVYQAKTAGLWKKPGPWQEYPDRMLMHRAAGFHFDDCWGDVLGGLRTTESVRDYPQAAFVGDGETVATYAEPPGVDPLLARADGEPAKSEEDDVIDVPLEDYEPPTEAPPEVEAEAQPAPEPEKPKRTRKKATKKKAKPEPAPEPAPEPEPPTPPAPESPPSEMVCERPGCGHRINPNADYWWTYEEPDGPRYRCQECGPRNQGD